MNLPGANTAEDGRTSSPESIEMPVVRPAECCDRTARAKIQFVCSDTNVTIIHPKPGTFTLMWNSTSSNCTQSGPSFAVSHIAFLSPLSERLESGPAEIADSASGLFQEICCFLSFARARHVTSSTVSLGVPKGSLVRAVEVHSFAAVAAHLWPRPPVPRLSSLHSL